MPSFHCGVEVQAALDAGLSVDFYRVRTDLAVDQAELEARLREKPGVVLLIHYFGQGQPATRRIALLCEELRVPLIEDCCHALFSRHEDQWLGTFGPIAAFSLPKVLGTMDGGLLSIDMAGGAHVLGRAVTPPPAGGRALWPLPALLERKGVLPAWAKWSARSAAVRSGPDSPALPIASRPEPARDYTRRVSLVSEWMAAAPQPDAVVQHRRQNWFWLESKLKTVSGYRNALSYLGEGTSPLSFALLVQDRARLLRELSDHHIEPYIFGRWPHPAMDACAFPEARTLRDHVLCLPVHQGLTRSRLEILASVMASLLPRHALDV